MEVTVPADYMGDVMSDLGTRRGQIQGMDAEGSLQKIKAHVPLEELDHYSTRLKSMTQVAQRISANSAIMRRYLTTFRNE